MIRVPLKPKPTELFTRLKAVWSSGLKLHSQIISPSLCDDVLSRIAPAMKEHIGCDLIDINPGVGLWSSKLHQLLKPRVHILAEPELDTFRPFLQPLLDRSDSRFRLLDRPTEDEAWDFDYYITKGLLVRGKSEGGSNQGRNCPLLIVANQSRKVVKKSGTLPTRSRIQEFIQQIQDRSGFQRDGSVRMLMWSPDSEKQHYLPRTIRNRTRFGLYCETSCHVEELSGGPCDWQELNRGSAIELESSQATLKRMEHHGIAIPSKRLDVIPQRLQSPGSDVVSKALECDEDNVHPRPTWWEEYKDLERKFAQGKLQFQTSDTNVPGDIAYHRYNQNVFPKDPVHRRLIVLRSRTQALKNGLVAFKRLWDERKAIESLKTTPPQNGELNEQQRLKMVTEEIAVHVTAYETQFRELSPTQKIEFEQWIDEMKAWRQERPLMMWDRRISEPVISQNSEFYPKKCMALLDFQPSQVYFGRMTVVEQEYFLLLISALYKRPSQPLGSALEAIRPGMAAALLPFLSSVALQDSKKRGQHDLENMPVRLLSIEMFVELAVALKKWTFKPSLIDISRSNWGFVRTRRKKAAGKSV